MQHYKHDNKQVQLYVLQQKDPKAEAATLCCYSKIIADVAFKFLSTQ